MKVWRNMSIMKNEHDELAIIKEILLDWNSIWWSWWEREYIKDVVYKVGLYDKMVKDKQDLAAMDHARVKGKQEAWRRGTKAVVKGE